MTGSRRRRLLAEDRGRWTVRWSILTIRPPAGGERKMWRGGSKAALERRWSETEPFEFQPRCVRYGCERIEEQADEKFTWLSEPAIYIQVDWVVSEKDACQRPHYIWLTISKLTEKIEELYDKLCWMCFDPGNLRYLSRKANMTSGNAKPLIWCNILNMIQRIGGWKLVKDKPFTNQRTH